LVGLLGVAWGEIMNVLGYLGLDQYGQAYHMTGAKFPRKWLLEHFGRASAAVMWQDFKSGGPPARCGWIVAGHWVRVFRVLALEDRQGVKS
jgi:hypothetical protein